jgi:Uri superfamily endonuclease
MDRLDEPRHNIAQFGCADKPAEKHYWLFCCERKIFFQLKKQAEKYGL